MWKRFLCRIGWHAWTAWDDPRSIGENRAQQFRKCSICNKQQRHIF